MRQFLKLIVIAMFAASGQVSYAQTIDFEGTALGTYSSLTFGDATFTYTGGDNDFDVVASGSPGAPIFNNALLSFFQNPGAAPFKVTFANGALSFTIGVGDYDQDQDSTHLRAFSAADVLLASADYVNPASKFGGDYLTVASATPIAYVTFWEDGPFPGAVYWDNVTITPIPEPEIYAMMLAGLGLMGFVARRRRQQTTAV